MEILVELLLQALWFILQFIFEMVLQIIGEALFELGVRGVRETFKRPPPSPALAAVGYVILGAIAGGISLWLFPNLFIGPTWARWANLVLTPVAAGVAMAGIGRLRLKKGQAIVRLDTFAYGFLFALPMAVVRFVWGK
jgi:hypothetical protein